MICDHHGCKSEPTRAPRVMVPSSTGSILEHAPLRMMTTLHFCTLHTGELKVADILSAPVKVDFERTAREKRPLGFKPDFEAAWIEYVLVTTPEYRDFLAKIDIGRLVRGQTIGDGGSRDERARRDAVANAVREQSAANGIPAGRR